MQPCSHTLSGFVSVLSSSSLLQCRTGSSGTPWGIWTPLLTEKFFLFFSCKNSKKKNKEVYRAATQLNWNNSFTPSFAFHGAAHKGEYNCRGGSPRGEASKSWTESLILMTVCVFDNDQPRALHWPLWCMGLCNKCYTEIKDQSAHCVWKANIYLSVTVKPPRIMNNTVSPFE